MLVQFPEDTRHFDLVDDVESDVTYVSHFSCLVWIFTFGDLLSSSTNVMFNVRFIIIRGIDIVHVQ